MKRKTYQVAMIATLVVVMVAFLSTIFLADANLLFAASGSKKSTAEVIAIADDFFLTEAAKEGFIFAKKIVDRNATITTMSEAEKAI